MLTRGEDRVQYCAKQQSAVSSAVVDSAVRLLLRSSLSHETHRLPSETKAQRDGLTRWLQRGREQQADTQPRQSSSSSTARASCGICLLSLEESSRERKGKEEKSDAATVHSLPCCGLRCHLLCFDSLLSRHDAETQLAQDARRLVRH